MKYELLAQGEVLWLGAVHVNVHDAATSITYVVRDDVSLRPEAAAQQPLLSIGTPRSTGLRQEERKFKVRQPYLGCPAMDIFSVGGMILHVLNAFQRM